MAEAIFKGAPHLAGHTSKPYLRKQRKHNSTADEKKGLPLMVRDRPHEKTGRTCLGGTTSRSFFKM
ncbi:MAG TPA: hypothetical protein DEQ51_01065 [Alphaproteobacteria bacterium]|nr:hypothetical protein [Alphaproteobacteria bacterium]